MSISTGTNGTWNLLNGAQISNTLNINEWVYITVVRDTDNNTLKSYHNGTLVYNNTSFTGIVGDSTNTMDIGKYNNSNANSWNGYIRDLRYRVGTGSEDTSNAVPTEAVTSEDSLTKLLTCHSPIISDGSSSARTAEGKMAGGTMTAGWTVTEPFSPYDYTEYSATDHGGSVYFDGNQDYILGNSGTNLGTGNWTVEGWMYITDTTSDRMFIDFRPFTNGDYVTLKFESSDSKIYFIANNSNRIASNDLITENSWVHIALVRSSGTIKMYINGKVQTQTYASTANYLSHSSRPAIGIDGDNTTASDMYGYISDVRVAIGTAHYTTDFIPPTAPLSSSGAELHIKGTDASIIDKSQGANLELVGNTTGSTTQAKFSNTKSMYFDAAGDYISIPVNKVYGFGTDDWTIETWLYCTKTGGFNAIFDTRVGTGTQAGNFGIGMYNTGRVQLFSGGIFYYPTDTLSFNTWQHFAVVKNSGTTTMYFNGTAASSTYSDSRDYGSSQPVQIGKDDTTSNYFGGYMQDFRITKGLARYTANFTPPTASLEG